MTKILSLILRANTPGFEKSAGKVATFAMRTPVDFIVNSSYQPGIIQEVAFVGGAVKFKALASQDLADRDIDPYYQLTINGKTYTFWVPRDTEEIFIGDTSDPDNLPGDLVRLLPLVPPSGGGNAAPPNVDTTPGNQGAPGVQGPPGNKGQTGDKGADGEKGADGDAGIITANDISDASAVGKAVITASDEVAARAAIDAVGEADLDDALEAIQGKAPRLFGGYSSAEQTTARDNIGALGTTGGTLTGQTQFAGTGSAEPNSLSRFAALIRPSGALGAFYGALGVADSAGNVLFSVDSAGTVVAVNAVFGNSSFGSIAQLPQTQTDLLTDRQNSVAYLYLATDTTHAWTLNNRTATKTLLTLRGAAGQSADIEAWANSDGVVMSSISASGQGRFNSLAVSNAVAATKLGNVTKSLEIFDMAGNSLGFVAIRDSIT